jgi:predicted glycosyltransferase
MRIWIDLGNSPHVPFFRPLIKEFERRGHQVEITARAFAQTVELARAAGLAPAVIGSHGGRNLSSKGAKLIQRVVGLARWARSRKFDLAVSHNSHEHIVAAWALGIRAVTLMDYEHHPANHLSFRLASRVIVPDCFPDESLRRCGAREEKVRRYHGIKEDVYLADFLPDPDFSEKLRALRITQSEVLVVARAPASFALYHRMEDDLFDQLLETISARSNVKVVLLARIDTQQTKLAARHRAENIIFPREALPGADLIAAADLVVSAGGTMNREAAALGVPAVTTFSGKWAAVDAQLVREGRLKRLRSLKDLETVEIEKKPIRNPRCAMDVRGEVVELILGA